jgi:hypothetical protein
VSGRGLDVFQRQGIFEKGQQSAHTLVSGNREHRTLVAHMIKADGTAYPPSFIFKEKRLPVNCLEGAPPGDMAWCQENAWMESDAFYCYLTESYYPAALKEEEISASKPVLHLVDGHKTHVTSNVIHFGLSHHIHITIFHPHSSHFCQPLNLRCFSALWEYARQAYM